MTYQLVLGAPAILILLASVAHVMLHAVRDRALTAPYLVQLVLLGCLGGAALTPLIDRLGG